MSETRSRILIIDDNAANLKVASMHLSDFSFVVLTARDGETGVARAKRAKPDLILLDVEMPGIDGYETCRRLKADPMTAGIPVIFMTARSQVEDKVRAFEVGGVDYVTKPFEAPELIARVSTHITVVRQTRQIAQHAAELQARVTEATTQLREELAERRAVAAERESLSALVRVQSEQLYKQTQRWLSHREDRDVGLAQRVRVDIAERIRLAIEVLQRTDPSDAAEGLGRAVELLSPALTDSQEVTERLNTPARASVTDNPLLQLSAREYEVFQLLTQGKSNKEIAYTLNVSKSTVSTYRVRVMDKLGVTDLSGLIRVGIQHQAGL